MKRPRPAVNRRDVLRLRGRGGKRFAQQAATTESGALGATEAGDLVRASRPLMGSFFEVRVAANSPGAVELATRALDEVEWLEAQLTVYRDDSDVSRLNASAHHGPVPVESGLFKLLQLAVRIGRETEGAYDVTAGALSVAWGFFKGPKRVPDDNSLADARARTGQHHLILDAERQTVAFDRPGVVINLGSIGKGFAIDRAAGVVRDWWWPTPALVHGGHSSLYALGSPPGYFGGRWGVALKNPFDAERPLGVLRLRNRGLGTSGTSFQHFEAGGRVYGHILDPRSGEPALGPASVTVLAPNAAEADALSTAFYLLGPEAAEAYVAKHEGVGAIFVLEGPADGSPRVVTLGLTSADFETELTS